MDFLIESFSGYLRDSLYYIIYIIPIFVIVLTWQTWISYIQSYHLKNLKWILLEIKIPKEISKPPEAMEVLFSIFNQDKKGNFFERLYKGFVPSWFSLEIASFSGDIHFYIRAESKFKKIIEDNIYSQYPEIEVVILEDDYVEKVDFGDKDSNLDVWAVEYQLTKDDYYPIKTYLDYNLKAVKKEDGSAVDPLTPFLETLGSLYPGEQIWSQVLIRSTQDRFNKSGSYFAKTDWKEGAQKELNKLQKRDKKIEEGKFPNPGEFTQTPQEKFAAEAISRSLTKIGFDCGWRVVYLAPKDRFDSNNIASIIGSTKHFNSPELNGFKPNKKVGFDFPWQDITGRRTKKIKWELFDAYRKRSYFYPPYKRTPFVLTSEELATIYRFPSSIAATPTLGRIESKRSDPPANLPI